VWTGLHLAQDRGQWQALCEHDNERLGGFHIRQGISSLSE
jgi:hypothetical protein